MTWRKCCEGRALGASWESWSAQRPLVGFLEERAFEVTVEMIGPYLNNGKRELRERELLLTRPVGHGVGLLSNPCGHCGIAESGGSRDGGASLPWGEFRLQRPILFLSLQYLGVTKVLVGRRSQVHVIPTQVLILGPPCCCQGARLIPPCGRGREVPESSIC